MGRRRSKNSRAWSPHSPPGQISPSDHGRWPRKILYYTVQAGWYRSVMGTIFNALVRRLGIRHIADTQCGFKLFRRSVAQDLFSVTCVDGYAFDLELLYIAGQRGYRIAEVPVNWADQPGSKVRPWRDGFVMLRELMAIRKREAQGRYMPRARPVSNSVEPAFTSEPSHF